MTSSTNNGGANGYVFGLCVMGAVVVGHHRLRGLKVIDAPTTPIPPERCRIQFELAQHFAEYGQWTLAHEHWEASRGIDRVSSAVWAG